jgi:CRP-like cAMP-binding protein
VRRASVREATIVSSRKPAGLANQNLILLSLDANEHAVLAPHLEPVSLAGHLTLEEPGEPIESGYFPNSGVISMVVAVSDGKMVEVGIVGREGFVGAPLAGGLTKTPHRALVQVAGDGYRIKAQVLQEVLPSTPKLRVLLTRYALVQGMQLAQTAACNRLHGLEQRLARWLLMIQDRVNSHILITTHERLATLLGTDRPSVSVVASWFQKQGIIEYKRGVVKVLSRRKLKETACECYEVIQEYYSQLGLK